MAAKSGSLSINSENIFPIIKKWLYSDHDIFYRELISNGCDAVTKLKKLDMMGEYSLPEGYKGRVDVIVDPEKKTLTFKDNGLGMTADEVEEYINQIAFSGATDFIEKYKDKSNSDQIIGHFGLGFYSAFMVADEVHIDTLSYKDGAKAVHWECDGVTEFSMEDGDKTDVGTTITLFLNEDCLEFCNEYKAREVVKKYCSFMPTEIYLSKANTKETQIIKEEEKLPDDEVLEEIDPENIASPSNAERADEAVYYTIPEVLEDQEVEIFLEEIVPGTHPAFEYAENINGVTVTISAAEGILPEGTTAKVTEVTDHVENAVKEKVENETAETEPVEVKSVLAYDITLYDAQGNVLNDSWSTNGYVHVSFSGAVIEEKSKEVETVEISHLDTKVDTTESVVTANEIKALEQVADPVEVPEEASVESVAFEAKHFSTYTVMFYNNNYNYTSVSFDFKDTDDGDVGSGSYSLWNVFTDNKEYTTEEAVSAVLNSANQSSVMDEYIFKEAKTAQDGGDVTEHGDGHDVRRQSGSQLQVLAVEQLDEEVGDGLGRAGVLHAHGQDRTQHDGHTQAAQRAAEASCNERERFHEGIALRTESTQDNAEAQGHDKQGHDRVQFCLHHQQHQYNDGNDEKAQESDCRHGIGFSFPISTSPSQGRS